MEPKFLLKCFIVCLALMNFGSAFTDDKDTYYDSYSSRDFNRFGSSRNRNYAFDDMVDGAARGITPGDFVRNMIQDRNENRQRQFGRFSGDTDSTDNTNYRNRGNAYQYSYFNNDQNQHPSFRSNYGQRQSQRFSRNEQTPFDSYRDYEPKFPVFTGNTGVGIYNAFGIPVGRQYKNY